VISCGGKFAGASAKSVKIVCSKIDGVELDMVFDMGTHGLYQGQLLIFPWRTHWSAHVDMQAAKILPKLLLSIRTNVFKVLVTENYNTPLRDQQGKLILLRVCQLWELQSGDLSADTRRKSGRLEVGVLLAQEVRLRRVCMMAAVIEVEKLSGREFGRGIVDW
jgi:hypothetical protein